MNNWYDVSYVYNDLGKGRGAHTATFYFKDEQEAKEFVRLAKISKDVDDELLFYGDGVLRTLEKKSGKHGKTIRRR